MDKLKIWIKKLKRVLCKHRWRTMGKAAFYPLHNDGTYAGIPGSIIYVYECTKCGQKRYMEM